MTNRRRRSACAAIAAIVALALPACGKPPATSAAPAPPPEIEAMTVAPEALAVSRTYVGRTTARRSVEIRVRITGALAERPFAEGSMVKAGDLLFRLDPREFEAALASAKAHQAQATAHLRQTRQDLARVEPLAEAGAAATQELDTARAAVEEAEADVEVAKAAVATAELQLAYAAVTAPFAGRIGFATRDVGAIIGPNDGALAVLDQVDPLATDFAVSERELAEIRHLMETGEYAKVDLANLVARAVLVDGSTYPHPGRIDATDVRVQPATGMSTVRAIFPNPDGRLVPGQFVRVRVEGLSRPVAIALPQSAVLQSVSGASVYVVGDGDVIALRPVRLGAWTQDGRWIIEDGLKAGDRVVVSSLMKVRPGQTIRPKAPQPTSAQPVASGGTAP